MSAIHHFSGKKTECAWEGIEIHKYGNEEFEGVTRQVIIGPQDNTPNFAVRYFRLEPGRHSNLERHPHEHGVVILHGRAQLQLNEEFFEVEPLDAIFISGNDLHQFTVIGKEPLGFLCVVTARK